MHCCDIYYMREYLAPVCDKIIIKYFLRCHCHEHFLVVISILSPDLGVIDAGEMTQDGEYLCHVSRYLVFFREHRVRSFNSS